MFKFLNLYVAIVPSYNTHGDFNILYAYIQCYICTIHVYLYFQAHGSEGGRVTRELSTISISIETLLFKFLAYLVFSPLFWGLDLSVLSGKVYAIVSSLTVTRAISLHLVWPGSSAGWTVHPAAE